ncbi:transcriptional regulator [Leptospira perolatii]|uniref:Transcriptional regulator n=2 Tax=Leptospira perolatii TaxID=2023191 RepID=A0A2M9ZMD0_9LEPT|nr:transcriptional regulator [Leptospira perolatii]PJZ73159.1 transcriptional regulator [Leptospira perolatii]
MNPTESRILTLLFNFFQYPEGLTLSSLKRIMSEFYQNENQDSDRRKLSRDIQELEELGFHIRYYPQKNEQDFVYVLEKDNFIKSLRFSPDELREMSAILLEAYTKSPRLEYYSTAQKIFAGDLGYFPELSEEPKEASEDLGEVAFIVLEALRNRTPIKMKYYKTVPEESYFIEVDPIRILRKGGEDYYLLGLDRASKTKKRFILPKILKAEPLQGDFLYQAKGANRETWEDQIVHAGLFPVHDPKSVVWNCREESLLKVKLFLSGMHFEENGLEIKFNSRNLEGLLPFLWKEPNSLVSIEPVELRELYLSSLKRLSDFYREL